MQTPFRATLDHLFRRVAELASKCRTLFLCAERTSCVFQDDVEPMYTVVDRTLQI